MRFLVLLMCLLAGVSVGVSTGDAAWGATASTILMTLRLIFREDKESETK